jgi:hypothetical protein
VAIVVAPPSDTIASGFLSGPSGARDLESGAFSDALGHVEGGFGFGLIARGMTRERPASALIGIGVLHVEPHQDFHLQSHDFFSSYFTLARLMRSAGPASSNVERRAGVLGNHHSSLVGKERRMNRITIRRMETGKSVCQFSDAHPSTDPSFVSVLGRLKDAVTRMSSLAGQQVGGFLSKHSSTARRTDVRRQLRNGLLRHLVTVGEAAAVEKPELGKLFQMPAEKLSNARFQAALHKQLELGQAEQELLLKHGLSASLLDDLSKAVAEFDTSLTETIGGKQDHVLASRELEVVSEEVMLLVGLMDGINRYRFQKDPQLLAAWKSARHVVVGPQTVWGELPVDPAAGQTGEVKPAA